MQSIQTCMKLHLHPSRGRSPLLAILIPEAIGALAAMALAQSTGEKELHLTSRAVLAALHRWNAQAKQIRDLRKARIRAVS